MGIEVLAVVVAQLDAARLYFKSRRITDMVVAVDPEQRTHQAFRVPYLEMLADDATQTAQWPYSATTGQLAGIRVDPTGELGGPMPIPEARDELNRRDGVTPTSEELGRRAHGHQLLGLFLIDRNGMIRWHWVEAMERPEDLDTFPMASEVLSAAQGVVASATGSELAPTEPR
jgi:hypothetical protein